MTTWTIRFFGDFDKDHEYRATGDMLQFHEVAVASVAQIGDELIATLDAPYRPLDIRTTKAGNAAVWPAPVAEHINETIEALRAATDAARTFNATRTTPPAGGSRADGPMFGAAVLCRQCGARPPLGDGIDTCENCENERTAREEAQAEAYNDARIYGFNDADARRWAAGER